MHFLPITRLRICRWSWFAALLAGAASLSAAETKVFLVLSGDPLAGAFPAGSRAAGPAAADHLARQTREQERLASLVASRGGRVLERYQLLNNALFIQIDESQVAALRQEAGVAAVLPERHYHPNLLASVPFSGATRVWSGGNGLTAATGKGIRIGIIDSGIDYNHAMFGGAGTVSAYTANNPTRIEPGTFPTAKVVGGTDFVGDNYDSSGEVGSSTPVPDPDPLDPANNGHGSHVAGIAAGFGVLTNGATFHGPYDSPIDPKQFTIGPGMAPEAVLYALKVFGLGTTSSSIIVKALNWAADPNGDGDTADHLDVVNLSLGSSFGDDSAGDPERDAINRLVKLGCVVTISAGNGGDTAYKVDSPGTADRAITVANQLDDGFTTGAIHVDQPPAIVGLYPAVEGEFTRPLTGNPPVHAAVVMVHPTLGCDPFDNADALPGKLAMIDRGTCFFADKIRSAMQAGAVGVIVVNNVDGPPFVMGGRGDTSDITIPGVMISRADGEILKAHLAEALEVTLSADVVLTSFQLVDTVDSSSSRGPVWKNSELKPDLSAPGASILSTKAGAGAVGVRFSGTSMAAPHAAGAAALLKQIHPSWAAEEIKAVLMNTAVTPLHSEAGAPYSESRVGAGRLAVDRAALSPVTVRAENDGGRVSLAFGAILASQPLVRTGAFILSNHGATPVRYSIASSNTLDNPGVRLVPMAADVVVPANGTARVEVGLEISPLLLRADADGTSDILLASVPRFALPEGCGELWFQGGPVDLHAPWYSVPRATTLQAATTLVAGTPPGNEALVHLPTRGVSGQSRPLVGVFQFGVSSPAQHFGGFGDATDVIATGAASDFATAGTLSLSRIYFAMVNGGAWPTPQRYFQNLDVEIDLDDDGQADVILSNNNQGSTAGNDLEDYDSANDALIVAVDHLDGSALEQGGVWNALPPGVADTAPFQNGMLVYSVTGAQLGLDPSSPAFRYRMTTTGDSSDTTGWARFDPTRPVVDATEFGINHTPWLDEGLQVRAVLNRANAAAAAIPANGTVPVLLVHAHGIPGAQADIVTLRLDTNDQDGDGLPDDWELGFLGDLNDSAGSDRDGDGFTDSQELLAGTDPADAASRLALLPPDSAAANSIIWTSVPGHRYTVLRSEKVGGPYVPWRSGVVANSNSTSVVDPELAARDRTFFYRVEVEP